jgi:hypothetical protein
MTLSISDQPSQWHRITKRHSLLSDATIDPFPYRASRATSLIDHHIVRDRPQQLRSSDNGRRGTVPHLPQPQPAPVPAPAPITAPQPVPAPPEPDPRRLLHSEEFTNARKRSLDAMPAQEISDSGSPSPTSASHAEGRPGYCLCQPEPKIPRPRNGEVHPRFGLVYFP